jgi:hypothetical protein
MKTGNNVMKKMYSAGLKSTPKRNAQKSSLYNFLPPGETEKYHLPAIALRLS